MIRRLWLYATVAALLGVSACKDSEYAPDARSEEQSEILHAINDSMQHLSPTAIGAIEEQMSKANDSLTWYDYYLMYGRHYLLTDTPDSLLPYTKRTLLFARRQQPTARLKGLAATALNSEAAYHYLMHHNTDSVISLYMEAYHLMMESDVKENLPDVSANIGDAYVAKSELVEGSRWYRRAIYLVDSLGLPTKNNQTLYLGLGHIYTAVGDFSQARKYYEKTEQYFNDMKPNMQTYFLNNYGNYFYYRHKYPEALSTFRRLKAHLEKYDADEAFDMFLCKVNMADVFLNLNKTDSARYYVKQAEDYFARNGVAAGVYYAHTIRIGIALHDKDYAEAERILQSEKELNMNQEAEMQNIRQQYLNNYYAAIGNYKRAYELLQSHQEAKDSTEYLRKKMRSEDIMLQLTEDTIHLHQLLRMKQNEAMHAKTQLELWISSALLIILLMAFALWYNHERKRKLKNSLDIINLSLSNARQRISPHFVFNVLNSRMTKSNQQETDQLMTMAKLIRENLDLTSKSYVTLGEELDFVKHYVEIERTLIGEDFIFNMKVDDESILSKVCLPSMLIQIMTENAILHGLKGKEGEKRLCIMVESEENETRISVCDNGPGFDIRHYNSERSRTGLNIIHTTLSAVNAKNPNAKIRYEIKNDNGCHSILTIPKNIKLI